MTRPSAHFIRHRINTVSDLATVDPSHGVELDLRDRGDRLILAHDPFADGEDFHEFLVHYHHGTMILNIKSERIESRVLNEIRRAGTVRDYFFLDCSFPMIRTLISQGERKIAVRFSEFEPAENVLSLASHIDWVWIDCFTKMPLDQNTYTAMKDRGLKLRAAKARSRNNSGLCRSAFSLSNGCDLHEAPRALASITRIAFHLPHFSSRISTINV